MFAEYSIYCAKRDRKKKGRRKENTFINKSRLDKMQINVLLVLILRLELDCASESLILGAGKAETSVFSLLVDRGLGGRALHC